MTYVSKASHLAKRLSKLVTMTGTKPALRGYSLSSKEWEVQACLSLSLSLFLSLPLSHFPPSILQQTTHAYLQLALSE